MPAQLPLVESPSAEPSERKALNVRDLDAWVGLTACEPGGGTVSAPSMRAPVTEMSFTDPEVCPSSERMPTCTETL